MELVIILLNTIVLLTSIPIGLWLAYLCKDELIDGKRWFLVLILSFSILFIASLLFFRKIYVLLTLFYMIIVTYMSIYKAKDEKFVKK